MKILLVEDRDDDLVAVETMLKAAGHDVVSHKNAESVLSLDDARLQDFDFAVLDFQLPRKNGLELGQQLAGRSPRLILIMLSGHGTLERKVKANTLGFIHFIDKPGGDELLELINLKQPEVQKRRERLRSLDGAAFGIIGECPAIVSIRELISTVAPINVNVFVMGESGTGKELVARAIHNESPRRNAACVCVNCAAIPETLLESELFGHERGAFTSANTQRIGKLEQADGGTLFLDEIGEMSPTLQAKLLRVLQDGTFTRVGGGNERRADFRTVSATHRDLPQAIKEGKFREDLYWRLYVMPIVLPPLRERGNDVLLLAEHFLEKSCSEIGKHIRAFSKESLEALQQHTWPGNVRELENTIKRAVALERGLEVQCANLQLPNMRQTFKTLPEAENELVTVALQQHNYDVEKSAKVLGVTSQILRRKAETTSGAGGNASNASGIWKILEGREFKLWKIVEREAVSKQTKDALSKAVLVEDAACPKGSRVQLMEVRSVGEIPDQGSGLVIIAKVAGEGRLHIRVFDGKGLRIVDKAEPDLPSKSEELQKVKTLMANIPSGGSLTNDQQNAILDRVAIITASIPKEPTKKRPKATRRLVDFVPPPPFTVDYIDLSSGQRKVRQIQFGSDYYPEPNYIKCLYEPKRGEFSPLPILRAVVCRYAIANGKSLQEALREMTETVIVDDLCFVGEGKTRIILGDDNLWNMERGDLFLNYSSRLKHDPSIHDEIKRCFPDYVPPAK